ncbi:MAG: Gfo/Idh/MocA family oxidoreductase [Ruminococcaceae bacterium]|nr:Gfo/Idh/MocA family oxidoreductase [Oscillospiraceae bacterium]
MTKPIKVGLVGLGRAGSGMHRPELRVRQDKFVFYAVCDIIEERTKPFVEEFGSKPYTRIEDLIADPEVELVTIATRSKDHFRHAKMALLAGKDVMLEKPFCITSEQAKELIKLSSQPAGPHLYIRHNRRFERGFELVSEIIDSGKLGDVYEVRLARTEYNRRFDWQTLKEFGGGHLFNWGSHIVDHALRFCGGDYTKLYSYLSHVITTGDCEDHAKLVFTGINGRCVDLEITYGVTMHVPEYMVYGTKGSLFSEGNTLHLRYLDPKIELEKIEADKGTPGESTSSRNSEPLTFVDEYIELEDLCEGTPRIWDALYEAIRENKPFPVTLDQALKVVETIEEAKENTVFAHKVPLDY